MILNLEIKKLKRTGYLPAFLGGALLASAFPLANMLFRPETFTAMPGCPFDILMDANWQMIAMLNILVSICGACMMYHTEYADNGAQKMDVLPLYAGSMFLGKSVIAALVLAMMTAVEILVLAGCLLLWFPDYRPDTAELMKNILGNFLFQWTAALPTVMLMLVIASACKNMWVSLGTGVILVFTLFIFPQDNAVLSLFPFSSPYQTLAVAAENDRIFLFLGVCAAEILLFGVLELIYQKFRRCVE